MGCAWAGAASDGAGTVGPGGMKIVTVSKSGQEALTAQLMENVAALVAPTGAHLC